MVSDSEIKDTIPLAFKETNFDNLGELKRGKVRDIYEQKDKLVLITTDRISAFDVVFPQAVPFKGQTLTQTAVYWFNETQDIISNHLLASPDPNVMVVKKCNVYPIEMVVRGYATGHMWREYAKGKREICGIPMPEGLKENQKLPEPIITPTTKSDSGDEDISREEIISRGIIPKEVYVEMEKAALALFQRGTEICAKNGLILVDTKYEFGDHNGQLTLIDEVHTGDSSRFWAAEEYNERFLAGKKQRGLDKEYVRQWSIEQGFTGKHPGAAQEGKEVLAEPPIMSEDVLVTASRRYIEAFEKLTGQEFKPDLSEPISRMSITLMSEQTQGDAESQTAESKEQLHEPSEKPPAEKPELSPDETPAPTPPPNIPDSDVLVPIIMGSKADMDFCETIAAELNKYAVPYQFRVASAHKTPEYLMKVLSEYKESGKAIVYITVAGMSNGLSGAVAANTIYPVIACPPVDKQSLPIDINSSLRMPSKVPSMVILSPKNAALAAARILGLTKASIKSQLRQEIEDIHAGIKSADEEVR